MLFLTINKKGNDFEILGKTDSGRTVRLNALDYQAEIDKFTKAVDSMEGSDLREAQKEIAKIKEENKGLIDTIDVFKTWTPVWQAGKEYKKNEPISYQGILYISQKDHKASATGSPDRDTTTYKTAGPKPGAKASF